MTAAVFLTDAYDADDHAAYVAGRSTRCSVCGKQGCFRSRKEARAARRRIHPGERMRAYQCGSGYWHFGHLPDHIVIPTTGTRYDPLTPQALTGIALVAAATGKERTLT